MPIDPTVVRDVVIVVPGIMGSELVDGRGNPVWSVGAGALVHAIRTFSKSVRRLELPRGIGDDAPNDGIRATGLVGGLHVIPGVWSPIAGYKGLLDFLRSSRFHLVEERAGEDGILPNLVPFPYDWRLSNRFNGKRLADVAMKALERWRSQPGMSDAKLVLICHSMGGLVARWFAEREGGAEHIRALVTIGTPFRGSVNALATLANGLESGIFRLAVRLLRDFVRSLPSLYQLLPQYACLVTDSGRERLSAAACPGLDAAMWSDAIAFHEAIAGSVDPPYVLHKVVGTRQPTPTTARVTGDCVTPSDDIDGRDQGGDGTVPRLSAEPAAGRGREVHEIANQHGELQGTRSLLDLVDGILSREEIVWQAAPAEEEIGVRMADLWSSREEPHLCVVGARDRRLLVTLRDETGSPVGAPVPVSPEGTAALGRLPEGGYRAVVTGVRPGGAAPVAKPFVVLDPELESGAT